MDFIHNIIAQWGYLGIFFIICVDNMNFPFPPTEVVLTLIGWFIGRGVFNIWTAFFVTTFAGTLGCIFFYFLIKYSGNFILPLLQKYLRISDDKIKKSNEFFHKYGGLAIFIGRVIPGMRTVSLIPAGMLDYPLPKFILYVTIGTAVWNGSFLFFGHIIHGLGF